MVWETGDIMIPMTIKNFSSDSVVNFMGNTYTTLRKGDYIISEDNGKEVIIINPRNNIVVEYAGKMNYYLSLLDRLERGADENRSIGIILCAEKDRVEVELALEDMGKPIGVADYQLIVPKEKLQKVLADEIKVVSEEKEIL